MPVASRTIIATGMQLAGISAGAYMVRNDMVKKALNGKSKIQLPAPTKYHGLKPDEFVKFPVARVESISDDTRLIHLHLDDPNAILELECVSHIVARAEINGKQVSRPYTPLNTGKETLIHNPGEITLLVKGYPTGGLSQYLCNLTPGSYLELKGPKIKQDFASEDYDIVTLIAGGTGIAPIFQILEHIYQDSKTKPDKVPKVNVLVANRSTQDILCKGLLDYFCININKNTNKDLVNVTFFNEADKPSDNKPIQIGKKIKQEMKLGRITFSDLKKLDPPSPKHKIFICGPPLMLEAICGPKGDGTFAGTLDELGYEDEQVFKL